MPAHKHVTYAEYDAIDAVRSTDLKALRESPLHYREREDKDTTDRGFLRALHCLLLEPESYAAAFRVYRGGKRDARVKAYQDFLAGLPPGATALLPGDDDRAHLVADKVKSRRITFDGASILVGDLLTEDGDSELTLTWTHEPTGLPCKARIDRLARQHRRRALSIDLKGYGTTNPREVGMRAHKLGALMQGAHYVEGIEAAAGMASTHALLVYETSAPYDVGLFVLDSDGALYVGQQERDALMATLAECRKTDIWPGRAPEAVDLGDHLPRFAFGDEDTDTTFSVVED